MSLVLVDLRAGFAPESSPQDPRLGGGQAVEVRGVRETFLDESAPEEACRSGAQRKDLRRESKFGVHLGDGCARLMPFRTCSPCLYRIIVPVLSPHLPQAQSAPYTHRRSSLSRWHQPFHLRPPGLRQVIQADGAPQSSRQDP